ncbi:heme-binding protein [Nitrospira sp. BLG_1]|uniref:heme-binding protein n=1 Tax=Nitrospira sp. BLG_1 TaxID=3395883 RepID=UPI0039BD0EE4
MKTKPAELQNTTRRIEKDPKPNDPELGPLKLLPGKWANVPNLQGRGWNMIALPFVAPPPQGVPFPLNYRLLVNQYNEELEFTLVDKAVPNRGVRLSPGTPANTDQFLVTLDYQQSIKQIAADDFPKSGLAGPAGAAIHHEPGLWLHMTNGMTDSLNIARLASIPHGDSVLALGQSSEHPGRPSIPDINGLPIGVDQDLKNPYLAPYKHFNDNLFQGLFNPISPNDLLEEANKGIEIERTTVLDVDSTHPTGGVVNIPFIVRQANATVMKSTFWIQELKEKDKDGKPKLRLQYSQLVMLDFFPRVDGLPPSCCPGLIQWPHVSINTLEKVC